MCSCIVFNNTKFAVPIAIFTSNVTINNCTLANVPASLSGGTSKKKFLCCKAEISGLYSSGSTVTVQNSAFSKSSDKILSQIGAISVVDNSFLSVENSTFNSINSLESVIYGTNAPIHLSSVTFTSCTGSVAAALFLDGGSLTMKDSIIKLCTANERSPVTLLSTP